MFESEIIKAQSIGREFLDLYALHRGEDKKIENILSSAKNKKKDIEDLLKLIKIKNIEGSYGGALCETIRYMSTGQTVENSFDFPLIDCNSSGAVSIFKELEKISINKRRDLIEFISIILDVEKNKSSSISYCKNQIKNAVSILGMLNAIEVFSELKREKKSNDYVDTIAIDFVFNKAYDDARVIKSANSLASKFKTFAIGYDLKNNTGNKLKTHNDVLYFVSENIKSKYLNFFKRQVSNWCDRYQTQQAFFLGYCLAIIHQLISEYNPKNIVIYSNDMHSIILGKWIKTQIGVGCNLKTLWIYDFHEYVEGVEFSSPDKLDYFLKSEEYSIDDVDYAVTVSPGLAGILNKKYKKEFFVIYNSFNIDKRAVDLRYKNLREVFNIEKKTPLIIYSGGVSSQRRVGLPLKAMKEIKDLIYCIITNDTIETNPELAKIIARAKQLGVDGRILMHPYVEAEYAWELMVDATASLSMLPRYPNGDIALPNKLFDAIKAKTPFFSSNNPELEKFINQNRCGAIFEADDENSFIAELKNLISSPPEMNNVDFSPYSWDSGFLEILKEIGKKI